MTIPVLRTFSMLQNCWVYLQSSPLQNNLLSPTEHEGVQCIRNSSHYLNGGRMGDPLYTSCENRVQFQIFLKLCATLAINLSDEYAWIALLNLTFYEVSVRCRGASDAIDDLGLLPSKMRPPAVFGRLFTRDVLSSYRCLVIERSTLAARIKFSL